MALGLGGRVSTATAARATLEIQRKENSTDGTRNVDIAAANLGATEMFFRDHSLLQLQSARPLLFGCTPARAERGLPTGIGAIMPKPLSSHRLLADQPSLFAPGDGLFCEIRLGENLESEGPLCAIGIEARSCSQLKAEKVSSLNLASGRQRHHGTKEQFAYIEPGLFVNCSPGVAYWPEFITPCMSDAAAKERGASPIRCILAARKGASVRSPRALAAAVVSA
jgi:hypothetical protein